MSREPLTPATEPVGEDGFTFRERSWLREAAKHVRALNDLLAERGRPSRYAVRLVGGRPVSVPPPLWAAASRAADWLQAANGAGEHETAMQLMKVGEEVGEVMQAYIGVTGQNPRKGITHKPGDVAAELCDVIVAAATVLYRFADDPAATLDGHAARVAQRIAEQEGGA